MGLKIHPRTFVVQKARLEIQNKVSKISHDHELTALEVMIILTEVSRDYMKYALREERHPNDLNKKADEA